MGAKLFGKSGKKSTAIKITATKNNEKVGLFFLVIYL